MRIIRVIESRIWRNEATGRTASIYGAAPWIGPKTNEWNMVHNGWTWEMDNNTIGMGRVPAKTRDEAQAIMDDINGRADTAALASLPGMIEANKQAVADAEQWLKEADYPAAKRSAKRRLKEVKARLAACEQRYAALAA